MGDCRGTGECHCTHCNDVRADERARVVAAVVAWLRAENGLAEHRARDLERNPAVLDAYMDKDDG